jgi:hypothetical protein
VVNISKPIDQPCGAEGSGIGSPTYSPAPHGWSIHCGTLTPQMTCWGLGKATGDLGPNSGVFFRLEAFPRPQSVTERVKTRPMVSK